MSIGRWDNYTAKVVNPDSKSEITRLKSLESADIKWLTTERYRDIDQFLILVYYIQIGRQSGGQSLVTKGAIWKTQGSSASAQSAEKIKNIKQRTRLTSTPH